MWLAFRFIVDKPQRALQSVQDRLLWRFKIKDFGKRICFNNKNVHNRLIFKTVTHCMQTCSTCEVLSILIHVYYILIPLQLFFRTFQNVYLEVRCQVLQRNTRCRLRPKTGKQMRNQYEGRDGEGGLSPGRVQKMDPVE